MQTTQTSQSAQTAPTSQGAQTAHWLADALAVRAGCVDRSVIDAALERAPIGQAVGLQRSAHLMSLMVMIMVIARASWARRWWMNRSVLRRIWP